MIRPRNGFLLALLISLLLSAVAQADFGLQASAVTVDITPPVGVPLAGYGGGGRRKLDALDKHEYATWFAPSQGILDPILAKVLVLRSGQRQLAFVAVDMIGASAIMRTELVQRLAVLGFRDEDVFLSGTHTHSGPGAFAKNWIFELIAADQYKPAIYDGITLRILSGVRAAFMSLKPATLSAYSFETQGLQSNRREHPGHVDPVANVLLVRDDLGDVMGGIANFAVHGTSLGADSMLYSGDAPGAMRDSFERALASMNSRYRFPAVLFINGSEGDVAPSARGVEGMHRLGESFAQQAVAAMGAAKAITPEWEIRQAPVKVGRPGFGLKACLDGKFPILQILGKGIMPLASTVFPKQVLATVIRLGELTLMTWPGEPTTSVGLALKRVAMDAGDTQPWVLGLTNDHLAYFVMPEEYEEGGYEVCSSLYGPQGSVKILDGYRALFKRGVR